MSGDFLDFLNDQRESLEIVSLDRKGVLLRSREGLLYRVSAVYMPGEALSVRDVWLEFGPSLHLEYHPEPAVPEVLA